MQPLTVALIQTATHWHDPAANRDMFDDWLARVPADANLVVLPEMFSTGFTMASAEVAEKMDGPTVAWMGDQARKLDAVVCGSLVIEEDGRYYNRFIWAQPDGGLGTYDKRHLFRMAGEHEHYSAGGAKVLFDICGWRLCPMVCYDLRFPVWFRNRGDYDILLCVANWPAARLPAWNTLLRARAIENQAYVAAVNILGTDGNGVEYGGGTSAYAPDGEVLVECFDDAALVMQTLDPARLDELRAAFPVAEDADSFHLNME